MSVPEISPLASVRPSAVPTPISRCPDADSGFSTTLRLVAADATPTGPPPELHDAMAAAAAAWQRLDAAGQAVRFSLDRPTGRVSAALTQSDGVDRALTGSQVLALADGQTIDGIGR